MASKVNIVINGKNMASKAIKDVTKDLSEAGDASNRFNDGMMKLAKFGLGTAIASVGAAMTASLASLKKSADFSDIRMGFETLLGSYSEAEKMLSSLQGLASKTPLQLNSVTEAATQLLAVGTDKNLITSELRMLGDLAMGNEQKFGLLTDAYAKLRAKGKVSLEELNRFTENGVPLLGQLAKNLGVSNDELQNMVSSGKIKLKDIQQAMKDLTEEGGMFFGMMEKKSQGVNGKLSTLRDNLSMTMIKWGSAFEPLAGTLLDNAIKKLDEFSTSESFKNFVETTVRWASWAADMVPKIGLVFGFVGEVIAITVRHAKEELDKVGTFVFKNPVIRAIVEIGGDTWDALKTGFSTGNWSPLFGSGIDITKTGISILATVQLASALGHMVWTGISLALLKSGFAKYGGLSSTGIIAAASIAIGLIEAVDNGGYEKFGKNLALALAIGIGIGAFTKSPKVGMLAFTIVMNLEWGEKILDFSEFHPIQDIKNWFEDPQSLANSLRASFIDIWRMSGIYAWLQGYGNDIGEDFGNNLLDSFLNIIKTFDLVGAFVDLWKFYIQPLTEHISSYGDELGQNFIDSFWRVISVFDLVGAFMDLWKFYIQPLVVSISDYADELGQKFIDSFWRVISVFDLVGAFVDLWNISLSPMLGTLFENGKNLGLNFLEGFKQGINNAWDSVIDTVGSFFKRVLGRGKEVLDERSPSKEAEKMGSFFIEGFADGINDPTWREEILAAWTNLLENLKKPSPINIEGTLDEINGTSERGSADGGGKSWISGIISKFSSDIEGIFTSLSSFKALMDPINTILAGAMTILEPLINKALAPLLGILTIVGKTIGGVLVPVFDLLASVTEILGRGFVWLYSKVILPVSNGIITVFNILYNAVAAVVNGIGNALRWLGVKMSMDYRSLDAGKLQAIDYAAMTASASTYAGSSSTGGSSSSVNQVTVNYYQTINGNVIGDSGMAELGDFFVRAVEAYIGSGGTVRFIQETA